MGLPSKAAILDFYNRIRPLGCINNGTCICHISVSVYPIVTVLYGQCAAVGDDHIRNGAPNPFSAHHATGSHTVLQGKASAVQLQECCAVLLRQLLAVNVQREATTVHGQGAAVSHILLNTNRAACILRFLCRRDCSIQCGIGNSFRLAALIQHGFHRSHFPRMEALSVNRRITITAFGNDIAGHIHLYIRRCHGKRLCSTGQCKALGLPCLRLFLNRCVREFTCAYQIIYLYILFTGDCDLRQIIRIVHIGQFHIERQNIEHIFDITFYRLPAHGHRFSAVYIFNDRSDIILLSLRKIHLDIKIVPRFGAFRRLSGIIFLTAKLLARLPDTESGDLPRFRLPIPVNV